MIRTILAILIIFAGIATAAEKPNIIYILADDLGINDFGCYGQEIMKTPRVDQMATEGMQFFNHYSGSTVCAPTRSCLMTGQHTGQTRVRGNGGAQLLPEDVTIPEMLKEVGYTTGLIGKWGLGEWWWREQAPRRWEGRGLGDRLSRLAPRRHRPAPASQRGPAARSFPDGRGRAR